ncbi:MAG: Rieske (2Fe-2S) protein [Marmoricola sp.]
MSATGAGPDRRAVVAGTAAVGLALPLLAACGDIGKGHPHTGPTGTGPLGPASEVPVGGGHVFADKQVVVTQPKAGEYKAFSAVCTHAGCLVRSVADGQIRCPCHGSRFSITDGSVVGGPAPAPLPAVDVEVANGTISLA